MYNDFYAQIVLKNKGFSLENCMSIFCKLEADNTLLVSLMFLKFIK